MEEVKIEKRPQAKISVVNLNPSLTLEQFDLVTKNHDVVVFIVYATGTSPQRLNGIIEKRTQEGIPVFLVSHNIGDKHGIKKIVYENQYLSAQAGAIPLEKVNVNNLNEIMTEIQKQFSLGKKGAELGKIIKDFFSYKEGEVKPIPDWENPIEIKKQGILTKQTFMRSGMSEEDAENEIKKIGF